MPGDADVSWRLIAVLTSSVRLAPALSLKLYRSAVTLHRADGEVERWMGDDGAGEVRRLGRELLIGSISGPGFEANVETEAGNGFVRFIVTREGLETAEAEAGRDARLRGAKPVWN